MPFGSVQAPSLGLSLLKAELVRGGVGAEILYLGLRFAKLVGVGTYVDAAHGQDLSDLVGEWIFSGALFDQTEEQVERYLSEVLYARPGGRLSFRQRPMTKRRLRRIVQCRDRVEEFLADCRREVVARSPLIVGFTSQSRQHVPSLALARRIKERCPETYLVFGGPNCEGVMGTETLRQFAFVDAVVSGDGDVVFPRMVKRLLAGRPIPRLPGVCTREQLSDSADHGGQGAYQMVTDLDELPYPDYDDFFEQLSECELDVQSDVELAVETSRGCWWGERRQCTFCGQNGLGLGYRGKSAQRAVLEIEHLVSRYPGRCVRIVDNALHKRRFRGFIPRLAERGLGLEAFCEVKADLTKDQIRGLRAAGITLIQPGIESLSTKVLKLMRKGVSAIQNVQLLKWCRELGVHPSWSILCGLPGEPSEEYARMAALAPALRHLPSPNTVLRVYTVRFGPLFEQAESLGSGDLRPARAYEHIYPFAARAVANLAYTFESDSNRDVGSHVRPLLKEVKKWKEVDGAAELFFVDTGDVLQVWDERSPGRGQLTALSGLARSVYLACDSIQSETSLTRLAQEWPRGSRALIREQLDELVERGLVIRDGAKYLSLAVPVGEYRPRPDAFGRFQQSLAERARRGACEALASKLAMVDEPPGTKVGVAELSAALGRATD